MCRMLQISGIEQELVCGNNNLGSHYDTVLSLVNDSAINDSDRCTHLTCFVIIDDSSLEP